MRNIKAIENQLGIALPSPLMPFSPPWARAETLSLYIKRDDLIHPTISGNKWRKLKYAVARWPEDSAPIISFGGGFSNHLHALGFVCHQLGIPFVAIVRGDYSRNMTPMLRDLQQWNAEIRFVSKIVYREKDSSTYRSQLISEFPHGVIVPEGGSQRDALSGLAECVNECVNQHPDSPVVVMCPVGTGATLAGLATALPSGSQAEGIAVLKGQNYLEHSVWRFLPPELKNWRINHEFHHGGYARTSPLLTQFCQELDEQTAVKTEPVYSGKLFYAARALIARGHFPPGTQLILLHSGGLQGLRNG